MERCSIDDHSSILRRSPSYLSFIHTNTLHKSGSDQDMAEIAALPQTGSESFSPISSPVQI
jgi:hypothetical protein